MLSHAAVTTSPQLSVDCHHKRLFLTQVTCQVWVGFDSLFCTSSWLQDSAGRVATVWDMLLSWQRANTIRGTLWWLWEPLLLSTSRFNSQNKSCGWHWCQWMREMSGRPLGMGLVERDGKRFRQIGEGTTEGLLGRKICVHDSRVTEFSGTLSSPVCQA